MSCLSVGAWAGPHIVNNQSPECPAGSVLRVSRLGFDLEERCARKGADGMWVQHGPFVWWFDKAKGIKRLEGAYIDDQEAGTWIRYYRDEKNSKKSHLTEYQKGKREGVARSWYQSGRLASESHYCVGKVHGLSRQWYPNGQLAVEASYVQGKQEGRTLGWYRNGKPIDSKTRMPASTWPTDNIFSDGR
jgi:hypothetical protein